MWSYLICVDNDFEADLICGLLEDAQIPFEKKYPGGLKASYGIINGVEVWVPGHCLEHARALLTAQSTDSENSDDHKSTTPAFEALIGDGNSLKQSSEKPNRLTHSILISFLLIVCVLLFWMIKGIAVY